MNNKRIAIVPGSFDPITNGHIDLVKKALKDHELVYLAVMINPSKKYMFDLEQRKQIAEAALSALENVTVISSEGMLWRLALDLKADSIVKGYRNETDLKYENEMAEFNYSHNPKAKTILLKAEETLVDLSSTKIRELISNKKEIDKYLPKEAIKEIEKILSSRKPCSK